MSSKLRSGQTVTIGERKYKVTRVDGAYRRCRICQENNKCLPCTNPDPTIENTTVGSVWNQRICNEQLPKDAYLKPCTNLDKSCRRSEKELCTLNIADEQWLR